MYNSGTTTWPTSAKTLAQIANSVAGSETLLNLTPILTNLGLCPKQAAADARDFRLYQQGKLSPRAAHNEAANVVSALTSTLKGSGSGSGYSIPFLPKLPVN